MNNIILLTGTKSTPDCPKMSGLAASTPRGTAIWWRKYGTRPKRLYSGSSESAKEVCRCSKSTQFLVKSPYLGSLGTGWIASTANRTNRLDRNVWIPRAMPCNLSCFKSNPLMSHFMFLFPPLRHVHEVSSPSSYKNVSALTAYLYGLHSSLVSTPPTSTRYETGKIFMSHASNYVPWIEDWKLHRTIT